MLNFLSISHKDGVVDQKQKKMYSKDVICEPYSFSPPFHFYQLPTQVPESPHCSQDSESAKILANVFGG